MLDTISSPGQCSQEVHITWLKKPKAAGPYCGEAETGELA